MDRKKSAWVIEDEDPIREIIAMVLREYGCNALTFSNAEKVMRKLRNGWTAEMPDFVITDVKLPGLDGFVIVEELVAKGFPVDRIAVMSGYWNSTSVMRANKVGIKTFQKPFSIREVLQWLETIFL